MAWAQDGDKSAHKADADYSAVGVCQYRAVKRTATGFIRCGAADPEFYGILQDLPKQGEYGTIKTAWTSKGVAGAAITNGAALTTDASGRFVTAVATNPIVARAEEAAAAAGDLLAVRISREGNEA